MARRRNPFATPRRKQAKYSGVAPQPIKVVAMTLNPAGLKEAFEWMSINREVSFKLAFEWYSNNLTTLLFGDPLDETRQKSYDRALKSKSQGDHTTFEGEKFTAWTTALKLYEKTWAARSLPKIDDALAAVDMGSVPGERVRNVQTVLASLNNAFNKLVSFRLTFHTEREFLEGEVLLPMPEIEAMIPMTPLKTVLREIPTVAKVLSIVTDPDTKEQSLDGTKFMETLPKLLELVADWAAGDRTLATKAVGKALKKHKASGGTSIPRAASGPVQRVNMRGIITVIDLSRVKCQGKRKLAIDLLADGPVTDYQSRLAGIKQRDFLGWSLKTAIAAGAITVA